MFVAIGVKYFMRDVWVYLWYISVPKFALQAPVFSTYRSVLRKVSHGRHVIILICENMLP